MKRIACFTATRAEYSLLRNTLLAMTSDDAFEPLLLVSGTHLRPEFGFTLKELSDDGFRDFHPVPLDYTSDSAAANAGRSAAVLTGLADIFTELQPHALMVIGDRYETLAAAQCACLMNIPVLHLHGGELSFGSQDNQFRHAISKLSHLHFPATAAARERLIRMGESPERVFLTGAPGVENIRQQKLMPLSELQDSLDLKWQSRNVLLTYHPDSMNPDNSLRELTALQEALDGIPDLGIIATYPNADAGHRRIIAALNEWQQRHPQRISLHQSLGVCRYLSLMHEVDLVVGNSSSGIIEAPSMKTPTINIGDRQKGRDRASSVTDTLADAFAIRSAIEMALNAPYCSIDNPYDQGPTSQKIVNILRQTDLSTLTEKAYHES